MRRLFLMALLFVGLLALYGIAYAAVDTADEVDAHSNTVVENMVMAISDVSDGNAVDVGEVGGIYIDGGSTASGALSAQAVTGAGVIKRVTYTPQAADDYIEIYDGTSRGNHTNCKGDYQGATAKDTINALLSSSFSTGIYVHNSSVDSTWQVEYIQSDQGE